MNGNIDLNNVERYKIWQERRRLKKKKNLKSSWQK